MFKRMRLLIFKEINLIRLIIKQKIIGTIKFIIINIKVDKKNQI